MGQIRGRRLHAAFSAMVDFRVAELVELLDRLEREVAGLDPDAVGPERMTEVLVALEAARARLSALLPR